MPRLFLALVLTLAVFLAVSPAAQARPRPTTASLMNETTQIGFDFWTARGLTECSGGLRWKVEALSDPSAAGEAAVSSCEFSVDPALPRARDAYDLSWLCTIVAHEVGHARGLTHSPSGLMAAEIDAAARPWVCRRWARRTAKRFP